MLFRSYLCNKKRRVVIHVAEKCRKLYSVVEGSTAQQKALLCNKKLYRTIESYTTQQKILLYSRKLYCNAESFTAQQKVLLYNRNRRKVPSVAKAEDKLTLQRLPLD